MDSLVHWEPGRLQRRKKLEAFRTSSLSLPASLPFLFSLPSLFFPFPLSWKSFLQAVGWKHRISPLSCLRLFATLWTVARQAPLSKGFPRQEYWNRLPFPSPGDLPYPGIETRVSCMAGRFWTTEPPGKPKKTLNVVMQKTNLLCSCSSRCYSGKIETDKDSRSL